MSIEPGPAARPYGRRADAERNRESVLDHAGWLLAEDPAIGMSEIAHAAGIGRATLYRHFPTREDLIAALITRAADEMEHAIIASRLHEGTPSEALQRLIAALLDVGDRYRFLFAQDSLGAQGEELRQEHEERLGAPVFALFERGQAAGEFARSLSLDWMTSALGAVTVTAVREVAIGRLDQSQAPAIVTATLLHGLSAGPDSGQERD